MQLDQQTRIALIERISPEAAALLQLFSEKSDKGQGEADALAQELHKILDDHLERDPASPGIRIRVLAAALAAKKHLEPKPETGWRYPKYGDKVRITKEMAGFLEFKVGDIKTVRGHTSCCPANYDAAQPDSWAGAPEPAVMLGDGSGEPTEITYTFPLSHLEPA